MTEILFLAVLLFNYAKFVLSVGVDLYTELMFWSSLMIYDRFFI